MYQSSPDLTFVVLWLGSRITGIIVLALFIMWGLFNGQMKNMQQGRFIALNQKSDQNTKK